jgi:hypothetical protein
MEKAEAKRQYDIEWRKNNPSKLAEYEAKRKSDPRYKEKQRQLYWKNREKRIAEMRQRRANNLEKARERDRVYRNKDKQAAIERTRAWRIRNKDRISAYAKKYRKEKADMIRATKNEFRRKKIAKVYAWNAERRAKLRGARVAGYNRDMVVQIYEMARRISKCTGIAHDVDHHIPLARGGPHHQNNLRVIPHIINIRKSAKMPPMLDACGT